MTRTVAVTMKRKNGSSYTTYKKPRTGAYASVGTPYVTKAGQRTASKINKILTSTVGSHAIETKTLDLSLSNINGLPPFNGIVDTFNTNQSSCILNPIQEGAGDYQRIGKRVNLKSIRLRGTIALKSKTPAVVSSGYNTINCRLVVVYFREQLAAIPDWNAVFNCVDPIGTKFSNLNAPLASSVMNSVVLLMDRMYNNVQLAPLALTNTDNVYNCPFDEYLDLGGAGATFQGTANPITAANITSGMLVMYMRADWDSIAAGEGQAYIYENSIARLRYTDV